MKKTWIIRALLLIAYCVPFALLCWGTLKTSNAAVLYIGNVLSFVSSYAAAKLSGLEPMGHYFKPFTSQSLIVAISVVVLIVHMIIVLIYRAKKRANSR